MSPARAMRHNFFQDEVFYRGQSKRVFGPWQSRHSYKEKGYGES